MKGATSFAVAREREALDQELRSLRREGGTLCLVPTMGSLHAGHLSLLERGGQLADATVVSIFVNRLQFGKGEDFDSYPRGLESDVDLCMKNGARLVFAPDEATIYPTGDPQVQVDPGHMGEVLCGAFRPRHFRGVLTVVAKLFGMVRPDWAVFGRKDYQQAVLIRQMVADLGLDVEIEIAPLVRDSDGLALSSRNAYLSERERKDALGLVAALTGADRAFRDGELRTSELRRIVRDRVAANRGLELEYVEAVDPVSLEPVPQAKVGVVLAIAAHCGATRLIDNLLLGVDPPDPRIAGASTEDSEWLGP